MKMTLKRLFSLMLAMCLLLSSVPTGAFAEEVAAETLPVVQTEQPAQQEEQPAEQETPDPTKELLDQLLAVSSYDELTAYLENMTEEQKAVMGLFNEEQNAALNARLDALKGEAMPASEEPAVEEPAVEEPAEEETPAEESTEAVIPTEETEVVEEESEEETTEEDDVILDEIQVEEDVTDEIAYAQEGEEDSGESGNGSGITTGPATETQKMSYEKTATLREDGFYDLELTLSGSVGSKENKAKLDVIFIVDNSNSMYESTKYMANLKPAMKSLVENISETNGDKIDARYAIAMFGTNGQIYRSFENASQAKSSIEAINKYSGNSAGGTNYQAGIYNGKLLLNQRRADATTVVIFVTDGLPTFNGLSAKPYGNGLDDNGGENYFDKNSYWLGNGSCSAGDNIKAAVSEIGGMACNYFYCIGIGSNFTDSSKTEYKNMAELTGAVDSSNTGIHGVSGGQVSALNTVFNGITTDVTTFLCSNVTITDTLHHVDGELMVEITDPSTVAVTVYQGDAKIAGPAASVTIPATGNNSAATLTASYDSNTHQLKLDFPDEYKLEPDYTYKLSCVIRPTEKAYEEYREAARYTDNAAARTGTHASDWGVYSNDEAKVTYTYEGAPGTAIYNKPVIQLKPGTLVINKTVEGLDAASLSNLAFDVVLTYPGKAAETQTVSFAQFTDPEDDGTYTLVMKGLSPKTSYTVTESGYAVEDYDVVTKVNGKEGTSASGIVAKGETATVSFTNTYKLAKVDISGSKTWDDNDNQDGKRPASITIRLLADGEEVASKVVTEAEGWAWTFEGQEKFNENGELITYTVAEDAVEGYVASYNGTNVTNTHEIELIDVSGSKTWNDKDNQDGARPASITIHLWANGVEVASKTVTAKDNWAWAFEGLEKYAGGREITYTVTEDPVPGYTAVVNGTNVTNTHEIEKTSISGAKTWNDADNQDGIRPASITINLLANGEKVASQVITANDGWAWTFANLDKYKDGQLITYTVSEEPVEGYNSVVNGTNVTNTHVPSMITISGSKTWDDADNQDGIRPASITIILKADGDPEQTRTVSAESGWSWTFENLPEYSAGKKIEYTISEVAVDGYTTSYNGYDVTNTHVPAVTSINVTKTWDDANNQDGKRPNSVTIVLLANDKETDNTLILSEGNNWTGSFENLPVYEAGTAIEYTIAERGVDEYNATIAKSGNGYTVTNAHTPETTEVSGAKTWDDNNNQDGARPASITINLLKGGEKIDSKVVTEDDGWGWSFPNLPKYEAGALIRYSISEEAVENYSTSYDGNNVTNTHTPAQTSVTVSKSWNDNNDQDGIRPKDITVVLMANGVETGEPLVLNEGNNWTGSFTALDKFENGKVITYTVKEIAVEGYTTAITGDQSTGYTITNTHTPETIEVSGAKTWEDNFNQDGKRPGSITINLMKDGQVQVSKEVTAADGWKWTFTNLPKYEDHGKLVEYAITESAVENYTTTYDGYNVTNTHAPEQTSVTVTKSWQDSNDQDGIRPNDITVKLLANGTDTGKTLVLNEGNSWTGSFTELDKFADGQEIVYTIEEIEVAGYESVITGDQAAGFIITNTHNPETVEVSGAKTWDDNNDQDGARPESITINLLKNGEVIDTKTVTAADDWAWSFTNLPKYENKGTLITYSITEAEVEDYVTTYSGYNVTNTHAPEKTSVTVTKAWQDNNDQDGIRPESITVKLLANDVDTGKTLVLNEGNNWTGSFADLDKYANGVEIVYTVAEIEVEGYNSVTTGSQAKGYTITNSHTPAVVAVSGAKTWADNNNQDGKRPASITINLLKNGAVLDTKTVTAEEGWAWSFTNLPKYENHGTLINYSIKELEVDQYTTEYNGFNVTNTHAPEKTSVSVVKSWQDNNDQDGIRPNDITVKLLGNGEDTGKTLVLNDANNWTGSFTDLDKYANGAVITYTVQEIKVDGYNSVVTGTQAEGYTITNSHTPAVVTAAGAKTWEDEGNQDGMRPKSITINLLADGVKIDSKAVTAEDGWAWSFTNLPKFKNQGVEIIYTISEVAVEEYSATIEGFNVINKHTPEETSVTVTKSWQDKDDQDGIRPEKITVNLLADGKKVDSQKISAEDNWTYTFTKLDVYAKGVKIVYTVEEEAVEGYETVITGDAKEGFIITNSHTPEVVAVAGGKTWDDGNNQDGKRPESITVNLLANGKVIETIQVTEAEGWAWNFTNLPKFEAGEEILYTVTEDAVEDYTTTYDGYNIINKYTPKKTSITVTKRWVDGQNHDGIRPNSVKVVLYANGKKVDTMKLTEKGKWSGVFKDLPVYQNGEPIKYTLQEKTVSGYNATITGNARKGFIVTNTHNIIPKTGDESNLPLYTGLFAGSMSVMAVLMYLAKPKKGKYAR